MFQINAQTANQTFNLLFPPTSGAGAVPVGTVYHIYLGIKGTGSTSISGSSSSGTTFNVNSMGTSTGGNLSMAYGVVTCIASTGAVTDWVAMKVNLISGLGTWSTWNSWF